MYAGVVDVLINFLDVVVLVYIVVVIMFTDSYCPYLDFIRILFNIF